MERRRCKRCGGEFVLAFFRLKQSRLNTLSLSARHAMVCLGCEQTAKDARKRKNRWHQKAYDAVRRHAVRLGIPAPELVDRFGWNVERIAHDLEHAYSNGCSYCCAPYKDMPNGTGSITLDVIDPTRDPYYSTNVTDCCETCNRAKGKTDPETWAQRRVAWDEWKRHQQRIAADSWAGTLFEGTGPGIEVT